MKNKLFYITYQSFPADTANSIQTISNLKYFSKNNYDVSLFFPLREKNSSDDFKIIDSHYNLGEKIKLIGVKHNFPFGKINFFNSFWFLISHFLWSRKTIKEILKEKDPDVYITRSDWILYFLSKKNKKVVFECHQLSKIRKIIINNCIKNTNTKIIFLNENLRDSFKFKTSELKNTLVAHNGVDSDLFTGKKSTDNKVIFVGNLKRFNSSRNLEFVIQAFSNIEIKKKFDLLVVGGPNQEAEKLNSIVKNKNLQNSITIFGRLKRRETIKLIEESNIGILINSSKNTHSVNHTSPLKYFEYLYGGLNVVGVDFPSHRNLPFSEKIFFFKEDNIEEFVKALKQASESPFDKTLKLNQLTLDSRVKKIINFINY
tara:strand:- start:53 stop:1171 length:1119 start_codon:yes stop_codon:yes gene_type:complete